MRDNQMGFLQYCIAPQGRGRLYGEKKQTELGKDAGAITASRFK